MLHLLLVLLFWPLSFHGSSSFNFFSPNSTLNIKWCVSGKVNQNITSDLNWFFFSHLGVGQYISIHATLTARNFFLISTLPVHVLAFFAKPLPIFPVLAVAHAGFCVGPFPRAHLHVVGMLRFMPLTWTNLACPLLFILFLCLFLSLWPFHQYFIP